MVSILIPRTKIIVTLGPSTSSSDIIERMALIGVSGFRINFAHGNPGFWRELVSVVREAEAKIGRPLALIGDLEGPSIRIGVIEKPIMLERGEKVIVKFQEEAEASKEKVIPIPQRRLFEVLEEGDHLVSDDGRVVLRVIKTYTDEAEVEALTSSEVSSRKTIIIRGKDPGLPAISERDLRNIEFAISNNFDYISISFVRNRDDIVAVKKIVRPRDENIGIISKIENREAIKNLEDIIDESDVVVIARGDLGVNFGIEEVPGLQEFIVEKTRRKGKPVVLATQILESMVLEPTPSRAEATDITVAVKQGVDAVMLTGETSIGKYPLEAVKWLKRILLKAEEKTVVKKYEATNGLWRYADSVVDVAEKLGARAILVFTIGCTLPPKLSASRPLIKTIVGASSTRCARKISIFWGLEPRIVTARDYESGIQKLESKLCREGELSIGENIVEAYRSTPTSHIVIIKTLSRCSEPLSGVENSSRLNFILNLASSNTP